MDVLLTLLPVVVVLALLVFLKWSADTSGLVGWLLTLIIAVVFFKTSLKIGLTSSLAGLVASFPVSLMVATSIFQITFLESTGALKRIVVSVKTISNKDRAVQIMIINMAIGTMLVAVGATPVSILPPIMLALGYSTFVAVALPALGFDSLCTYALLGAPLVVFSDMTKVNINDSALVFSQFMPVISTLIGFGMLWIVGGWKQIKEGFVPCLLAGLTMGLSAMGVAHIPGIGNGVVLTGVIAGLITVVVMSVYLKIRGERVIDRAVWEPKDLEIAGQMPLWKALAPWMILIAASMIINLCKPVSEYLSVTLAMPWEIIPGNPVKTRMLWNAYTWVLISTFLAIPFLKPTGEQWKDIMSKWVKRAPRPVASAMVFFAIAYVMMNSGAEAGDGKWIAHADINMVSILATKSAAVFKGFYPAITAFLGLLGGFVTGSEASTIAMFAKYNSGVTTAYNATVDAAKQLNPLILTASIAIAGGLASVISPAKLQNAAATIDALGIEAKVIKVAVVISLLMTTVLAVLTYMWA